jgi:small subunit ribosomal protein S8
MTMTDPIADMLTRIRNANNIYRKTVDIPSSRMKEGIADALKREGFIENYTSFEEEGNKRFFRVELKYGPDGEKVISTISRVSKPGKRVYRSSDEVKKVLSGYGAEIYTTNLGILSDRECRQKKVGGEVLLFVK